MTVEDATAAFSSLSREQQIRFLVCFAHGLTIAARGTYEAGTDNVTDARRLRKLNEVQHRVVGHAMKLLDQSESRFPDDVLVKVITGEGDGELLWLFGNVVKTC